MSVIVDLEVPSEQFELGRILDMEDDTRVVLETMVPMGERMVLFFRVHGGASGFERSVSDKVAVTDIHIVSEHDGEILYALDWDISEDTFFSGLLEAEANLLEPRGISDTWTFELSFRSHDSLSAFHEHCGENKISIDVQRLYNPTKPEAGPWLGLSPEQRLTLTQAVEEGYYSIPRQISAKELSEQFDITDQAAIERLRRAVRNLVAATLLVSEEDSTPGPISG
jgi:predicted DNA binding protein